MTYPFLSLQETKFAFFGSAVLKEGLCVGMKVNDYTKWLKIPLKDYDNLFGIFDGNSNVNLAIQRSTWKSLINGSFMHVSTIKCYKENSVE